WDKDCLRSSAARACPDAKSKADTAIFKIDFFMATLQFSNVCLPEVTQVAAMGNGLTGQRARL
ncbi:MAG: hypothetical protein AAGA22_09790, partial [Pseudomonadota bacterium]